MDQHEQIEGLYRAEPLAAMPEDRKFPSDLALISVIERPIVGASAVGILPIDEQ